MEKTRVDEQFLKEMKDKEFLYCKKHNIFYDAKLEEERKKFIAELKCSDEEERFLFSLSVHACPLCNAQLRETLHLTMGSSKEMQQYENFQEGDVLYELASMRDK